MRTFFVLLGTSVFGCGVLAAQNPESWTGLLVTSTCNAQMSNSSNSADRMSDMTAKKTPSAHETNTTYEEKVDQSDRNTTASSSANASQQMHRTTPTATASSSDDQSWEAAQKTAGQMPKSCKISSRTSAYALRLNDGRMVQFDNASNTKIHDLLMSGGRLNHEMKIFRVIVKGNMSGDQITLDSIQM